MILKIPGTVNLSMAFVNHTLVPESFKQSKANEQIPDSEWEQLESVLIPLDLNKDEMFVKAGDKPHLIGIIESGVFRTFCMTEQGNERTLAFRQEGQLLAGYAPFLMNRYIWYSIQALEPSRLVCFSFSDLNRLSDSHPCWKESLFNFTVGLYLEKESRERSLLMEDAKGRYLSFLKEYSGLSDRIPQYHIASYLGISPISLSRIKSELKK